MHVCISFQQRQLKECITNIVGLGVIVISGFALSIGPFVFNGTLGTLLARLFPFKRGLTHAYWAPNFWALYSAADRLLVTFHKMTDPNYVSPADAKVTSGLVQDSVFAHLPQVCSLILLFISFQIVEVISKVVEADFSKAYFETLR